MRARRTVLVAATLPVLVLAACTSVSEVQQWPDAADPTLPLPADSAFAGDGTGPVQDDGGIPFGSLDPADGEATDPASRVPAVIERGRLIVGVSQSMNQLGFRDPVTGEMAGFEVALAHEIARDIFGDPSKVDFRYVEDTDREDALRTGDVDFVLRSMTVTRARQATVEFSAPYLRVSPRLLVNRDSGISSYDDLADRTVCATRDSTNAQAVAQDIAHGQLLLTEAWPDCLMAMQRGQVDAIYSDSAILSGLRAQDPNTVLVGDTDETEVYGAATAPPTQRDTSGLVRQINATLERIRDDGTWQDLYAEWLEPYMGAASQPVARYRTDEESTELRDIRVAAAQAASASSSVAAPASDSGDARDSGDAGDAGSTEASAGASTTASSTDAAEPTEGS